MKKIILLLIVLFIPITAHALNRVKVEYVNTSYSDTIWINDSKKKKSIKIYGIKTISKYENLAIKFLDKTLKSATKIEISEPIGNKKHNSFFHLVYVDNVLLESILIKSGYYQLSVSEHSLDEFSNLCEIQKEAYHNKLGIWEYSQTEELICHNYVLQDNINEKKEDNKKIVNVYPKKNLYKLLLIEASLFVLIMLLKIKDMD